jgi:hypothetical protein
MSNTYYTQSQNGSGRELVKVLQNNPFNRFDPHLSVIDDVLYVTQSQTVEVIDGRTITR